MAETPTLSDLDLRQPRDTAERAVDVARDLEAARAVRKAVADLNDAIRAAVKRGLLVELDGRTHAAPGVLRGVPYVSVNVQKQLV